MEYPYIQQGFRSCLDDAIRVGNGDGNNNNKKKKNSIGNGDGSGEGSSSSIQLRKVEEATNTNANTTNTTNTTTNTTTIVVVDYATFKLKLKMYSQRRQKIRRFIDLSSSSSSSSLNDETIYVDDFENILKEFDDHTDDNNNNDNGKNVATTTMAIRGGNGNDDSFNDEEQIPYVSMNDNDNDNDNEQPSGIWCGGGGETETELKAMKREQQQKKKRNNLAQTKTKIKKKKDKKKIHRRNIMRRVSNIERNDIIDFLSNETVKLSLFYLTQLQIIQQQFTNEYYFSENENENENEKEIIISHIHLNDVTATTDKKKHQQQDADDNDENNNGENDDTNTNTNKSIIRYIKLGKQILDLYLFCSFNILIIRQLLIRYDGFARMYEGTPMMEFYMKTLLMKSTQHKHKHNQNQLLLRQIFLHEEVIALCDSYQKHILLPSSSSSFNKKVWSPKNSRIKKLPSVSESTALSTTTTTTTPMMIKGRKMIYDEFQKGRNTIQNVILTSSSSSSGTGGRGRCSSSSMITDRMMTLNFTNDDDDASAFESISISTSISFRMIDFIRKYFLNDTMEDSLGWYLNGTNRGRNLTYEMHTLAEWKYESSKRWSTTITSAVGNGNVNINVNNVDGGEGSSSSSSSMIFELRSSVNDAPSSSNSIGTTTCTSNACGGGNGFGYGFGFGLCGDFECGQCRFIEGEINLVNSAEDDNDDDYIFCGDGLGDSASTGGGGGGGGDDNIHESNTFDSILLAVTTGTGSSAYYYKPDYNDLDDHDVEKDDDTDAENIVSKQQKFNLFMSLAGAFLYCMNYYIVEPSSTMYVNALGAHDAAGATLIGMMPIASFFSAIAYSVWTNKIYRSPFLVSCCLMVSGNIVYSAAFNYKSLSMALIGRFMTGLGGPKMIVRRYIADTTCLSIRTSVNALLGMVIAAGSALGPGCAIMLSNFDFIISMPITNTELWFNAMTGPGWFMAVMWSIFSITLWWGFQEQERIGLKEKLQKEATTIQQQEIQLVEKTLPTTSASLMTVKSCASMSIMSECYNKDERLMKESIYFRDTIAEDVEEGTVTGTTSSSLWSEFIRVSKHLNFPVRLCMMLLFAKVFVIEILVSCTSALSKNRYGWNIHEVGLLGCANGFFVIPLSILVGKLSMSYQDRFLMVCLLSVGICGLSLLIDYTDLFVDGSTRMYNKNNFWSVGPTQYVIGYFLTYVSIQSFEGIIGSALSKVIPTALATGSFNSGLLATLVDTFGRSCGDIFISLMGFINIRQLMNLLFIPGNLLLITCLILVRRYYDILAV